MFTLASPRLSLRLLRDEDAETFAAYRSDPEVARYQGWDTPYPLAEAQAFITLLTAPTPPLPGEWYQLGLELKDGGALIGDCAFIVRADDPRQAEIGYSLARAYQGQGYGSEAVSRLLDFLFGEAGLHRVVAITDVGNTASIRLLERVGFRREAHYIENVWFKGAWGSEYAYGMLEREWAERRGGRA
jgi:RimJ/RimL family protein N-acetyltransferase